LCAVVNVTRVAGEEETLRGRFAGDELDAPRGRPPRARGVGRTGDGAGLIRGGPLELEDEPPELIWGEPSMSMLLDSDFFPTIPDHRGWFPLVTLPFY
jgi:hypothetical protein